MPNGSNTVRPIHNGTMHKQEKTKTWEKKHQQNWTPSNFIEDLSTKTQRLPEKTICFYGWYVFMSICKVTISKSLMKIIWRLPVTLYFIYIQNACTYVLEALLLMIVRLFCLMRLSDKLHVYKRPRVLDILVNFNRLFKIVCLFLHHAHIRDCLKYLYKECIMKVRQVLLL